MGRNPVGVFLSVLTLAVTAVALILESGLSWGCVGASALATAGWAEYDRRHQQKIPKSYRRPTKEQERRNTPPPRRPTPKQPPGKRPPKQVIKCTSTGRDIDQCDCHSRHIRDPKGSARYKKPLGTPFGSPKGGTKPEATPLRPEDDELANRVEQEEASQ
jgi:hypothetical protein